jgi:hypothetical protein
MPHKNTVPQLLRLYPSKSSTEKNSTLHENALTYLSSLSTLYSSPATVPEQGIIIFVVPSHVAHEARSSRVVRDPLAPSVCLSTRAAVIRGHKLLVRLQFLLLRPVLCPFTA